MRQASVLGKLRCNGSQSDTEITLKLATSFTIWHWEAISYDHTDGARCSCSITLNLDVYEQVSCDLYGRGAELAFRIVTFNKYHT